MTSRLQAFLAKTHKKLPKATNADSEKPDTEPNIGKPTQMETADPMFSDTHKAPKRWVIPTQPKPEIKVIPEKEEVVDKEEELISKLKRSFRQKEKPETAATANFPEISSVREAAPPTKKKVWGARPVVKQQRPQDEVEAPKPKEEKPTLPDEEEDSRQTFTVEYLIRNLSPIVRDFVVDPEAVAQKYVDRPEYEARESVIVS